MENQYVDQSNRLYVQPTAPGIADLRDWLFANGFATDLHVDDSGSYFDVTLSRHLPDDRRRQLVEELAAIRAKLRHPTRPAERSDDSNRLYVDPQDVRLEKVREWLHLHGLSSSLLADGERFYFDVKKPPYWPDERRRDFAADLAAFRAEFS